MDRRNDKSRKVDPPDRVRFPSDDVTSLDSWSEISSPTFSNGEGRERERKPSDTNDMVILNPGKLGTIHEPGEPKLTRVRLLKSTPVLDVGLGPSRTFISTSVPFQSNSSNGPVHSTSQEGTSRFKFPNAQSERSLNMSTNVGGRTSHVIKTHEQQYHDQVQGSSGQTCACNHCENNRQLHPRIPDGHYNLPGSSHGHHRMLNNLGHHHGNRHKYHLNAPRNGSDFSHNLDEIDQGEKVKNKILSVWNNVKYGWTLKTKTNFRVDCPIFVLGRCYHKRPDDEEPLPGHVSFSPPSMELFKQDFESRLWFTYRKGFQALPNTRFTTDCGWGCMLRSGQMIIAQAFINHFLGRDWRVHTQSPEQQTFYRQIIRWFADSLSDQCPFSIHHLAEQGKEFGKDPGDWYGPSSTAYVFRNALQKASLSQPVLKKICIYVAQDCTVYKQDVIDMCTMRDRSFTESVESNPEQMTVDSKESSADQEYGDWQRGVIILIPVRLGGEEFNPIYTACIKNLMAQDCCLGIIGGKPKHSLYFIGWQEDKLIYLDPHYCQDYVDTLKRDFKIETFHCFSPRKISLKKMDPSGTVGFYCRTREDFNKFVEQTEQLVTPAKGVGPYPMFVFSEGKGNEMDLRELSLSEDKFLQVRHVEMDSCGRVRSDTVDSEEFVVL